MTSVCVPSGDLYPSPYCLCFVGRDLDKFGRLFYEYKPSYGNIDEISEVKFSHTFVADIDPFFRTTWKRPIKWHSTPRLNAFFRRRSIPFSRPLAVSLKTRRY